jgi:3-hydroxyisobutyrate dehydrogenase
VSDAARSRPIGWIGTGRMGAALVERLLDAGCDVAVWNRTREKAAPLAERGATIVDTPADLADRDMVVTMVSSSDVLADVVLGERGLLTRPGTAPALLVDSSTVSMDVSARVRTEAAKVGTTLLAAPVSGNPKVVKVGRLGVVVSGPRAAFEQARPYLELFGSTVTYVGEEDRARLVKICHNLLLGIVAQGLAETTVLAEAGGVARADYLGFINGSVMGSTFSQYKTPALVNLDWTPMFTSTLLRKDVELGLEAAREHDVTLPVSALVHQLVVSLMGHGHAEDDFATLLKLMADAAGLELVPDDREVSDGLGD